MKFYEAQLDSYEKSLSIMIDLSEIISSLCSTLELEPVRFLRSIAHVESRCGLTISRYLFDTQKKIQIQTRRERAYGINGKYYNKTYSERWGIAAESSWGIWQVMYPNLIRFGLMGTQDPFDVDNGISNTNICANISIKMILYELNRVRLFGSTHRTNLDQFADAWNSGNFKDNIIPQKYIRDIMISYETHRNFVECPDLERVRRS